MFCKGFRLSSLPVVAVTLSMVFLKACSVEQASQQDRIEGVTAPFYQSTTISIPLKPNQQPRVDTLRRTLYTAHLNFLRSLLAGELKGYPGKALSNKPYSKLKIRQRAGLEGFQAGKKPLTHGVYRHNFITNIDQKRFYAYRVTLKWNWQESRQYGNVQIYSVAPYFRPTRAGEALGAQPLASFNYQSALNTLTDSLKNQVEKAMRQVLFKRIQGSPISHRNLQYQANNNPEALSTAKRSLNFRADSSSAHPFSAQFAELHRSLLASARSGRLTAYKTDSLASAFASPEAVRQAGATREVIRTRKQGENGPYLADTTIYTPLRPSSIGHYRLLERWQRLGPGNYQLKLWAIGPAYQPERGGVTLAGTSLFWVKAEELSDGLNGAAVRWLKAYSYRSVQCKLAEKGYKL